MKIDFLKNSNNYHIFPKITNGEVDYRGMRNVGYENLSDIDEVVNLIMNDVIDILLSHPFRDIRCIYDVHYILIKLRQKVGSVTYATVMIGTHDNIIHLVNYLADENSDDHAQISFDDYSKELIDKEIHRIFAF